MSPKDWQFKQLDVLNSLEDQARYKRFVRAHDDASPYHCCSWALAVQKSYGFTPMFFVLEGENGIEAVIPCVKMRTPKQKHLLCSLPYCDLGGVLANDDATANTLLEQVKQYAIKKQWLFEYRESARPNKYTASSTNAGSDTDFDTGLDIGLDTGLDIGLDSGLDTESKSKKAAKVETEQTALIQGQKVRMLFELEDDVDKQLASFKPKLRSQIKKAAKNGITARTIALPNKTDWANFYGVFSTNMRDLGSPVHSLAWFKSIFSEYENRAFMVRAFFEDKCVGGAIVLHTDQRAAIPWASTLRDYNKLAPNMLMYWEVLSEVIRRGMSEFDFGRSGYNEGTFRFKKQWGAHPLPLDWFELNGQELTHVETSEHSKARALVESTWQKMPLGLTTFIGPKVRKFISL